MSVSGRNWEVALGRLTRAKFKVAGALRLLEKAQSDLVDGEEDGVIWQQCQDARQDLDMASGLLQELGVSRSVGVTAKDE